MSIIFESETKNRKTDLLEMCLLIIPSWQNPFFKWNKNWDTGGQSVFEKHSCMEK